MKRFPLLILALLVLAGCKTNPFTGKKTLALVSNDRLLPMAFQQYDQFLTQNKVITGTAEANTVKSVGQAISTAAERYLNANGFEGYLNDYSWEYNLVQDDAVNAWCMPGGKIVFYTGIMPVCQDATGVAVVMGHEVAHALANHGQQRMSQSTLQQIGAVGVAVATASKDPQVQQQWMQAYGIGTQVGVALPFSRANETEADVIGLTLMAIAGYNPEAAPQFWERMQAKSNGQAPPEFMSTHPHPDTRVANLTARIDEAKAEAAKYGVTTFKPYQR